MPPRLNKFPEGTKFSEWHLSQEDWGIGIRRHYTTPDGKRHKQRYPLSKYKHFLGNEGELARLVVRLNGDDPFKRRAREVTELWHAYVSPEFLEKYYNEVLRTSIAAEKDSRTAYRYLVEYGLHFFMIKLGVQSPIDWEQHQFTWARSLLNRPDDDLPDSLRLSKTGGQVLAGSGGAGPTPWAANDSAVGVENTAQWDRSTYRRR